MIKPSKKRLKLVYAAGPGNVIGTYIHWREGCEDPSQVAITYSGQFYDVVRELNAQALVISSHPSGETVDGNDFRIEHRRIPFINKGGILYHIGQTFASLRLLWKSWRFGADVLIVSNGSGHWFPLRLAPLLNVKVIPTLHCTFWCSEVKLSRTQRILNNLARPFFVHSASCILAISTTITNQIEELSRKQNRPVLEFLPIYRREQFELLQPPPVERKPFRVLFAGRIERYKGVFDLLEVAKRLHCEGRGEIEFDLAGSGSSLAELNQAVMESGETFVQKFRIHGQLEKNRMQELFARAHVIIVPTTTDFTEGLNKVVVEGVLSGRPVITSSISNAIEYVKDAVVEVPPNDTKAYADAIKRLRDDNVFYEAKVAGCSYSEEKFYDPRRGWGAMLKAGLTAMGVMKNCFDDRDCTQISSPIVP